MTENKLSGELKAFERHLEAYGANEARWPETAHERFASLPSRDPRAKTLLAEARALDRMLDRVPTVSAASMQALADRILVAASRDLEGTSAASDAEATSRVIALRPRPASLGRPGVAGKEAVWQVAALLAASLVAGVFIGNARSVSTAVQSIAQHTVLTSDNGDVLSVALFDEQASWPASWEDEDSL